MWQPAPPPTPPRFGEEYLLQMADYYQVLVEYHEEAAKQAKERLFHLSMLIGDYPTLKATLEERRSALTNGDNQSELEEPERLSVASEPEASLSEPVQSLSTKELEAELAEDEESENLGVRASSEPPSLGDRRAELSNNTPVSERVDNEEVMTAEETETTSTSDKEVELQPVEEAVAPRETTSAEADEPPEEQDQELIESLPQPPQTAEKPIPGEDEIEALLEANRGKILHLEYIVMDLAAPKSEFVETVTTQVDERLRSGEVQGHWARVPDSPNCWTIDLKEIPDLIEKKKNQPRHEPRGGKSASLPPSLKLTEYSGLPSAIQAYMRENADRRSRTGDIFAWLYPDGVPKKEEDKTKKAINNALLSNQGKLGWVRVGKGEYAWAGS